MQGELFALTAALIWALSVILFKQSEQVSAQAMNLFKNVVAALLLVVTMPIVGVNIDTARPLSEWVEIVISGVLGIAVADTLVFMALRRLGASLLAVVDCVYAPTFVILSVAFLDESLSWGFAMGAVLVVGGVLVATSERAEVKEDVDRRQITLGVIFGITGIVTMAIAIVIVKPALERGALVEVTFLRLAASIVAQGVWMAALPSQRHGLDALRPGPVWKTLLPASVLGSYVAMLFWLGGFKHTDASTASVLNQMATVFTIVLARIILKETVSPRRATGAGAAVLGALLVLAV